MRFFSLTCAARHGHSMLSLSSLRRTFRRFHSPVPLDKFAFCEYHWRGAGLSTSESPVHWSIALKIISRRKLLEAGRNHGGLATTLDAWYWTAKSATWQSLAEVRRTYPSADGVRVADRVFTVFNIGGNSYRLVAGINYLTRRIFIKHVLTHAEYDKGEWKR